MSLAEPLVAPTDEAQTTRRATTGKVLLLGNDDRVILAVARGLGRNGVEFLAGGTERVGAESGLRPCDPVQ